MSIYLSSTSPPRLYALIISEQMILNAVYEIYHKVYSKSNSGIKQTNVIAVNWRSLCSAISKWHCSTACVNHGNPLVTVHELQVKIFPPDW